jgi:F0F1-type ATP synthase delta subunit
MRASWYAKALYALTASGDSPSESVITHFVGTVSKNGHTHMLHKILRAYERILAKQAKHETITVTTALALSEA